jgi:DinB family protein
VPEVLVQPAGESSASREEALTKARGVVAAHRAAFERLGVTFDIDREEVVIDWQDAWGAPLALLLPLRPSLLRAAVAHLNELETELDATLSTLSKAEWARRDAPDGWSVRLVVDHLASGCGLFLLRVEPWPLDLDEAQRGALEELLSRVALSKDAPSAFEQFGWNAENGRVRWTARKVVRVVHGLQEAWLKYSAGSPAPPEMGRHADADDDDDDLDERDIAALRRDDAELRRIAREHPRVREITFWYRYYRDRLIPWPDDELERWRMMRRAFRERLLTFDEHELASIRLAPSGGTTSVRQQLGLALAHVPIHAAQIDQIRAGATMPDRG